MWTEKGREHYDRSHSRYESDRSDREWSEVDPFIPPANRGSNKRPVDMRQIVNGVSTCSALAARGERSQTVCRPGAPCMVTWNYEPTTERWSVSITHHMRNVASKPRGKPV